jgi:hypothetical protein
MELMLANSIKEPAVSWYHEPKPYKDKEKRKDLPFYLRDNLPDKNIYHIRKTTYSFKSGFLPD